MRKFLVIAIPVVILAISILIMLSGSFFKMARSSNDNVPLQIDSTTKAVLSDNWTLAEENANKLETAWTTIVKRIQFSCERDEMHALSVSIARLKAAVTLKDKTSALLELNEAEQHWHDLGR